MSDYAIALFFHIVGALGLFAALGLEWTGLWQLRSAMAFEQVRAWMGTLKNVRKVGFACMLATILSGIYLMVTEWGGAVWIYVTLGSLFLMIALAQVLTSPRMAAIGRAMATQKVFSSQPYHNLANRPFLWISIQTRVAIALGIVFLKIARPDLAGSLLTIGAAIVIGLVSALPMPRRERVQEGSAD